MPFATAYECKVLGHASPRTMSPASERKAVGTISDAARPVAESHAGDDRHPAAKHDREHLALLDDDQLDEPVTCSIASIDASWLSRGVTDNGGDTAASVWGVRSVDSGSSSTSIIGDDERTRVTPCTSQPYQWIVSLQMRFPNNKEYKGSGALVRIGDGRRTVVLTCAHNLYSARNGGYAAKVTVTPARDAGSEPHGSYAVTQADYRVAPEYLAAEDAQFDYAAIFLSPEVAKQLPGFGFAELDNDSLMGRIVETAGYPADKPNGTMWLSGGVVTAVDAVRFNYTNDTMGGSSGSPVWTWATHNFVTIGIHGLGHVTSNSCRRIDRPLVERVIMWSKEFK